MLGLNECNKMPFSYPFYAIMPATLARYLKIISTYLNACNEAQGTLIYSDILTWHSVSQLIFRESSDVFSKFAKSNYTIYGPSHVEKTLSKK